jgi:superoxide dismutase, Cu-Zn family
MKSRLFAVAAAAAIATAGAVVTVPAHGQDAHQHGTPVAAKADIKGKGIAGTAEFSEQHQGNGTDPDANHPYHMGDVPNLEVGADGRGEMKIVTTRVTLSEGPLSVFDADGTAIIVHANEDKGTTGAPKSGVSGGPRAACGVLTKK